MQIERAVQVRVLCGGSSLDVSCNGTSSHGSHAATDRGDAGQNRWPRSCLGPDQRCSARINSPAASQAQSRTPILLDDNGLGRPRTFSGDEPQFQRLSHRKLIILFRVVPEGERLVAWAAAQTEEISSNEINDEFVVEKMQTECRT